MEKQLNTTTLVVLVYPRCKDHKNIDVYKIEVMYHERTQHLASSTVLYALLRGWGRGGGTREII
jgi:hypothetical protein